MSKFARFALGWTLVGSLAVACSSAAVEPTATGAPPSATIRPSRMSTRAPSGTPAPTATESCTERQGTMEQGEYESTLLPQEVPVWVYLPPCFGERSDSTAVLYLLHGKPFDESHWPSLGLIPVYERGLAEGRWGPSVLVFPRAPEPLFSSTDGGPGSYEVEFIQTVMPYIEAHYGAARLGMKGLAGISRGGIWALEIGLRHPEAFASVAALSPSLAVNYPRETYDPFNLVQGSDQLPDSIFLLAGEQDWARADTERLYEALRRRGAPVELELVPGEHVDSTWSDSLPLVLEHILKGAAGP